MTQEKRLVIKIASHFLHYPDESLCNSLQSLAEMVTELPPGRTREVLADFLTNFRNRKLLSWQEEYSRNFDFHPAASLNLTYHKYGDGRDRGAALAKLHQVYRGAGFELVSAELPDYLPAVLEFLSVCPEAEYAWVLKEYRPQVETLAARLKEAGTPYAALLSVVTDSLRD